MAVGTLSFPQRSRLVVGSPPQHPVYAWEQAVILNGGTVGAPRLTIVGTFIDSEISAGTWDLTDDYFPLWGESAAQALVSLKQLGISVPVASPTFTTDRGYTFNGTTQYNNTGFIPSLHARAMQVASSGLGVYERTNVNASTYASGIVETTNNGTTRVMPRSTGGTVVLGAAVSSGGAQFTLGVADSRGWTEVLRDGPLVTDIKCYKNGAALTRAADPTSAGTALPPLALFIGAQNASGTPTLFRASELGLVRIGGALTADQAAAQYTNIQTWATAIGANV